MLGVVLAGFNFDWQNRECVEVIDYKINLADLLVVVVVCGS